MDMLLRSIVFQANASLAKRLHRGYGKNAQASMAANLKISQLDECIPYSAVAAKAKNGGIIDINPSANSFAQLAARYNHGYAVGDTGSAACHSWCSVWLSLQNHNIGI